MGLLSADAPGDRREISPLDDARTILLCARYRQSRLKRFMGRGLVEPVDDVRLTNPHERAAAQALRRISFNTTLTSSI